MKYKNTIQLLIKDIQDIEKLLDNFSNNPTIPLIEIDLALSKLRNIYEILVMFRNSPDNFSSAELEFLAEGNTETNEYKNDNHSERTKEAAPSVVFQPTPNDENTNIGHTNKPITTPQEESFQEVPPVKTEQLHKEPSFQEREPTEQLHKGSSFRESVPEEPILPLEKEVAEEIKSPTKDSSKPEVPASVKRSEHPEEKKTVSETSILGEKYKSEKNFINERIGAQTKRADLKSKLQGSPITSIAGSIGINDKFFLIRELFRGNPETFRQTMETLDHSSNFNEAYNYLTEHFSWDMESEPVQQLLSLIRRKFIRQGND